MILVDRSRAELMTVADAEEYTKELLLENQRLTAERDKARQALEYLTKQFDNCIADDHAAGLTRIKLWKEHLLRVESERKAGS